MSVGCTGGVRRIPQLSRHWGSGLLLGLLSLLLAGCSPATSPAATPAPPLGGPEFGVIIVTTDLAVGANRVVFGLVDREGMPVRAPEAQVRAVYLPAGRSEGEVRQTTTARFQRWPVGEQGVFSTRLELDLPGFWELEVRSVRADGAPVQARGAFQVRDKSYTPGIGEPAPRSVTPTSRNVSDLGTISSARPPDPELYRLSIHEALGAGKPLVVVFATPAFCVSFTCGPQVQVVSALAQRYRDRANFIHVEVFQDPNLVQGGRPSGAFVPTVAEWGLPTEPWIFVMDGQGRVRAKFEAFTTGEEIEAALKELL